MTNEAKSKQEEISKLLKVLIHRNEHSANYNRQSNLCYGTIKPLTSKALIHKIISLLYAQQLGTTSLINGPFNAIYFVSKCFRVTLLLQLLDLVSCYLVQ